MNGQPRRFFGAAMGLVFGLLATEGSADVDLGRLATLSEAKPPELGFLSNRDDGRLRLFVTGPDLSDAKARGLTRLRAGLYALTASTEQIRSFAKEHPNHRLAWAPPRRVMLDHAAESTRANVAHDTYGLTGNGVVVGIVDTGVDVRHPDLRRADGTSRVAWLLDLSQSPAGKQAALEEDYDCGNADAPCAIYSGTDIDELIGNSVAGDEPRDDYGHGTHVASLAAGNGLSTEPATYVGIAPSATLIVVRATRDDEGMLLDPDIYLATQFIFDMADQMGLPAVVNLSLGGDFGGHDGSSDLERELAALVDDSHPGHSIVVAGGNSGGLYANLPGSPYPDPLGIHVTTQVTPSGRVRVPLIVGASATPDSVSPLYIWIATRPEDELSVGLETSSGELIAPVGRWSQAEVETDEYAALLQNGVSEDPSATDHFGIAAFVGGYFSDDTVLALTFEGQGTASIWVQPGGGIDPSFNGYGALFPGAQREGTITVPASAPALIAVGASLDRTSWIDVEGVTQEVVSSIARSEIEGEVVPFSAAGPNALDQIKPDVVAPGAYVVGAMSRLTDPRTIAGESGMFSGAGICSDESQSCLVVDDYHALSLGTSMASPMVAGAVALLLEYDPGLTQAKLLNLLQAGARNPYRLYATATQPGAGLLDIVGSLTALRDQAYGSTVAPSRSYLTLGVSYVRPEPTWPVAGMVHLRDEQDRAVDVEVERLALRVQHGHVATPLTREGPGFYRFAVAGARDSGGQTFAAELLLDGALIVREERRIATDSANVTRYAVAGQGCALSSHPARSSLVMGLLLGVLGFCRRLRRAKHQLCL